MLKRKYLFSLSAFFIFIHAFSVCADADLINSSLIEVPSAPSSKNFICIFYSGDGGWVKIDREMTRVFTDNGIPCIGIDSRKYFKQKRQPEEFTGDLEALTHHYLIQWNKQKIILMGFSRGADILPFALNRLSPDLKNKIELVVLLGPEKRISFQSHLLDLVLILPSSADTLVSPEIARIKGYNLLCIFGKKEKDSPCTELSNTQKIEVPGKHHFEKKYRELAELVLRKIPS